MIALLAALLVAAAQPASPPPVTIQTAAGTSVTLAVEADSTGDQLVRADRLAEALRGTFGFIGGAPHRPRIRLGATALEFAEGTPFVRVGEGEVAALTAATRTSGDRVLVALDVVTDLLPRVVAGYIYDAERRQLRTFQAVATTPRATRPPTRPPAATPSEAPRIAPQLGRAGRHVVVVDAGHGGPDAGMHGPMTRGRGVSVEEKQVTLAIARRLRDALEARGVAVHLTRSRDTLVALADRGKLANMQRGELFVSIHVNAANPTWRDAAGTRGFETYFLAEAKSEDARRVAELENGSVQYESAAPSATTDPLGFILSDMAQNAHLRESSRFAAIVQRRLAAVHPAPNRGVKQAGFKVLVTASMPAILVEVGYGSNVEDATFMSSEKGQLAIASAIADAAVEYFGKVGSASDSGAALP